MTGKLTLHVQSPGLVGLDSKSLCYSKPGGRRNLNRIRLENLFHRIFQEARLDLTIEDRFGNPVRPREWFLVPFHVIDEAVRRIQDGSITDYVYDPATATLTSVS